MTNTVTSPPSLIHWVENDAPTSLRWHSESGASAPKRVVIADDRMTADAAFRLASEGTAMLWRGDFQNARQLLQALARRADRKPPKQATAPGDIFNFHRQAQSQRARTLAMVLIPFDDHYIIPLRRAPDVQQACTEAYGVADGPFVATLRELLGLVGAHEWRKKGVEIPALGGRIHPHYGVFSPVRGEYVGLVAEAPLPTTDVAFDIGTGTGVLAAVLARRGITRVVATDQDPRALACAKENLTRLGLMEQVALVQADLFPPGRAALIVCNPPWLPARPSSPIEYAVYDPESRMLKGFLNGLAAHLAPGGEGWLILSDLAEHLTLRSRASLLGYIEEAGLSVVGRMDIKPHHPKAADASDPLYAARAAEVTSLWRLSVR
ncbi:methyltransferase [Glaciimonas immobilis]|uniref:SAM-dependent methyltransferase n=1 Tax=Glaciimonas immobilis TaxID=728004 RepID=A0A840S0M6_9BURK|nr:class I SAM-dependent methyltransferase [Glaciimonas immobilis]KAF3995925.1 class I SAM-dependent methyltransferase [Glaciimonas immobilis]MBB5202626.1 SAM-dependent methyltransferase [Glaciimonas immobilis]